MEIVPQDQADLMPARQVFHLIFNLRSKARKGNDQRSRSRRRENRKNTCKLSIGNTRTFTHTQKATNLDSNSHWQQEESTRMARFVICPYSQLTIESAQFVHQFPMLARHATGKMDGRRQEGQAGPEDHGEQVHIIVVQFVQEEYVNDEHNDGAIELIEHGGIVRQRQEVAVHFRKQ